MTNAEIVIEFIKGRPELEADVRKLTNQPYLAPECIIDDIAKCVLRAMLLYMNEAERRMLMRMDGRIDWSEVAKAFMTRPEPTSVDSLSDNSPCRPIGSDPGPP